MSRAGPDAARAIGTEFSRLVQVVADCRASVQQGRMPPTYSADIINLCVSFSTSITKYSAGYGRREHAPGAARGLQERAASAAEWLAGEADVLLDNSHTRALRTRNVRQCLPMPDVCALAFSLHDLGQVVHEETSIPELAERIAQHAALQVQLGCAPPSVLAWKDLLHGLTKAGLVANMDNQASQEAVKQHSTELQQLLDQGAQHLPSLLSAQGAAAQNVSLTLLAYAYAGYTGDLGPVTQALASNLEDCLQGAKPQECSNILWALGKLCQLRQQECQNHKLFSHLLGELLRQLGEAKPQEVSNAVYGCALAGHVEGVPQLLDSVCQQPQIMARAKPREWSNTLWAIATMYESAAGQDLQGHLAKQLQHSGDVLMKAFLQQPQALQGVISQDWSNTLWAAAKLKNIQQGSVLLERLAGRPQVMQKAEPQAWSNILWATATMSEAAAEQDLQGHLARQLQRTGHLLMRALLEQHQVFSTANPQAWSNILLAAAKLGCVEQGSQLLSKLLWQPQVLQQAQPQTWSNTLWAVATLYQTAVDTSTSADKLLKGGHLLLQACASSPTALQGAKSQAWSNTLWAAAVLRWYDQHVLSQGAAALAAMPPAEVKPQEVSNALYACAFCAHWDDNVQQLMGRVEEYDLAAFSAQALANTLYAWAVLYHLVTACGASQQHWGAWTSAARALFKEAARRDVSSFTQEGLRQLYAAHLYYQHLGTPGLPAGALLEAAMAARWSDGEPTISARQREVASVLQQLGYTTQLEMRSPDGVMSADVGVNALPDGSPCSIAVEFDGPFHYVIDNSSSNTPSSNRAAPVDRLDGPTRLRNAFLQARFPDGVVCIPWKEWVAASKAKQQEEYLRAALAAVLEAKVGVPFIPGCTTNHVGFTLQGPKLPIPSLPYNSRPQAVAATVMTSGPCHRKKRHRRCPACWLLQVPSPGGQTVGHQSSRSKGTRGGPFVVRGRRQQRSLTASDSTRKPRAAPEQPHPQQAVTGSGQVRDGSWSLPPAPGGAQPRPAEAAAEEGAKTSRPGQSADPEAPRVE
jgi:hypothetical protein